MFNPFQDPEGNIQFPLKPTADRIFLFPSLPPEKFQENGTIIIPEQQRKHYRKDVGIILALGPGYYDSEGEWHPMSPQLKVGTVVKYDITVPWEEIVKGLDGKQYAVVLCGNSDILGVIGE